MSRKPQHLRENTPCDAMQAPRENAAASAPQQHSGAPSTWRRNLLRAGIAAAVIGAGTTAVGCFTDASGRAPDTSQMYFPTGLTVSPGGSVLYVTNSDFDLQFSAGWLHALDAGRIRQESGTIANGLADGGAAAAACAAVGLATNPEPWLNPGPCAAFELAPFIGNTRLIGAFASGVLFVPRPDSEGARLFLPVRGDPSITYFEVDDDRTIAAGATPPFRLDCNTGEDGFCGEANRLGRDPDRTQRGITLPADPVGIATDAQGEAIVSAHQTQGAASLVHNDWQTVPELSYFASNLGSGPNELVTLTQPAFVTAARENLPDFVYRPSFALTYRNVSQLDILTYFEDEGPTPPRPFVVRTTSVPLNIVASSVDSRGITLIDDERRSCETSCEGAADAFECQISCAEDIPLRIYVANRNPASLLVGRVETIVSRDQNGDVSSAFEEIFFFDSVPLNFGPARVENGNIVNLKGEHEPRVFITCFDSRTVFIFDPKLERVESIVRTGRGPQDVASDAGFNDGEPYAYLHVGHFTDSYMGVVDLDMRRAATYGQVVANFGVPTPPKEER